MGPPHVLGIPGRTSDWTLGILRYALLVYVLWANHFMETLVTSSQQQTEICFIQSELHNLFMFASIPTYQNCSTTTNQNTWYPPIRTIWFRSIETVRMWKPHLHKIELIGNLGRNFFYKRQPPLCLSRAHFQFLPEVAVSPEWSLSFSKISSFRVLVYNTLNVRGSGRGRWALSRQSFLVPLKIWAQGRDPSCLDLRTGLVARCLEGTAWEEQTLNFGRVQGSTMGLEQS